MTKTDWETIPELQTVALLVRPSLIQHYKAICEYFDPELDKVLDIGHNNEFEEFFLTATTMSENSDLINLDLSEYNTLYFSESVGFLTPAVLEHLISAPSIKKIFIKDFISTNPGENPYLSYDFTMLHNVILPMLNSYGYTYSIENFQPFRDRWKDLLKKYNVTYTYRQGIVPAIVLATR